MGLLQRIFGKWLSSDKDEEHVTDKTFGNMVKFRVGSTVSISDVFSIMVDDSLQFKQMFKDHDFGSMIVTTILSFKFDGSTVYRLYCENPETMLQIVEGKGGPSYMLFIMTQETALQDEAMYNEWYKNDDSVMKSATIDNGFGGKTYEFNKTFGPVSYIEVLEADDSGVERAASLNKTMTLFDRETPDGVEYALFDAELDDWIVEGFVGLDVPAEEVTIL